MPAVCHAFHGATMHAWHRTWHGYDALNTPLRPYFVPRYPGRCDREAYAGDYGAAGCNQCGNGASAGAGVHNYGASAIPWLPLQSERLGQIPNDMGVGGAVPVSAAGR